MATSFLYFGLPAILLLLGFPIFLALFVTCIAIVVATGQPLGSLQIYLFGSLDNYPLLAVPFFVLAGEIMAQGGIARRILTWVTSLVGGVRGSLGITTVVSSEVFGAMTHTAVGTVVAVGRMVHPSLRQNGYDERFAAGLVASSGAIAVVIPPSIAMIIYSMVAQQSAIALFTAGILPSLLIGLIGIVYVKYYSRAKMVPLTIGLGRKALLHTTKEAAWSLGTIFVIFGGIYGGIFTPTEAAGVAVVYSILITMVIHREVGLSDLWRIILSAATLIAQIMMLVAAAGVYASLLTTSGLPQQLVASINALELPGWATLLSINVLLLIMGSFLEPPAAILILKPLLLPIVQAVGVDPIHFGIIMAVNLSIGMYCPPFGLNLFAAQAVCQAPLGSIYRGVLPFVAINFVVLMIITYVPAISMVLLSKPH
jgi:C4-dicarboxylate transporter DctM subunit